MEIDADVEFQRRSWVAQRIGWWLIALAVIAALLGSFGGGPLSRTSAVGDGLRLQYERFSRLQRSTTVRFSLGSEANSQIAFSRRYIDAVRIEQIIPEPSEVAAAGEWLIYRFAGRAPLWITFIVKPEQFGALSGAALIPGGRAILFRQFIYP
jgi:hypothetical protein